MAANIINLTTHPITDLMTGITYPPSGIVARADTNKKLVSKTGQPAIYEYESCNLDGLPEPKPNTLYIVSNMALNAVPKDRQDVIAPGPVEKYDNKPIGCRGFRK